jgi:uroporphyrinogen decarboxylase
MGLTSLERVIKAVRFEEPDTIPVGPMIGNHSAILSGIPLKKYYTEAASTAKAQYVAWETYHQDIALALSDNYYIAQGFGCVAEYHDDTTPTIRKTALSDIRDVGRLRIPDPRRDGRMPVYLEALERLNAMLKGQVCVRGTGTGPFSLAGHLLGINNFLVCLAEAEYLEKQDRQEWITELMEKTSDALIDFCKAQFEAGANIVQCGDSLASNDVISPRMYQKYAFPYEKKVFEALSPWKKERGRFTLLHICGNNTKVLDLIAQTGADIFEVDYKMELAFCREKTNGKMCLMGNLDPVGVLLAGTPEIVAIESENCLRKAGGGGGFILGSGCEVPPMTPPENLKAMVLSARRFLSGKK